MSDNYDVRCIRNFEGDPYANLQAAILYQAFSDYAGYCKILARKRRKKGDLVEDPFVEMRNIREYLSQFEDENRLLNALEVFLKKRRVPDMLKQ